jgi:predicted thioesterase
LESVVDREVVCSWTAEANEHLIGKGKQIQKILDKARFDQLLQSLQAQL